MVPVAQWQSATLWMWMLWVQAPSGTPLASSNRGGFCLYFPYKDVITFEDKASVFRGRLIYLVIRCVFTL
jgi:hypothetical protein